MLEIIKSCDAAPDDPSLSLYSCERMADTLEIS